MRDLRDFSIGDGEEFVGAVDGGDLGDEVAGGGERVVVDQRRPETRRVISPPVTVRRQMFWSAVSSAMK